MARGTGRSARSEVLEALAEEDPEAYEELLSLRQSNPQRFRKRLRSVVEIYSNRGSEAQRGRGAKLAEALPRLRTRRYVLAPELGPDGLNEVTRRALEGLEEERGRGHSHVRGVSVSVAQIGSAQTRRQHDPETVLNGTVGNLKKALSTGELDAHLERLHEMETSGRGRSGALKAIEARMRAVS